jgi:hypothetical protein
MANGACFKHIAKIYVAPVYKVVVLPQRKTIDERTFLKRNRQVCNTRAIAAAEGEGCCKATAVYFLSYRLYACKHRHHRKNIIWKIIKTIEKR